MASLLVLKTQRTSCTTQSNKNTPIVYQYKICPFCHRAKAYLDFLGVDYETVEVNPMQFKDRKKVPIAIFGDETINDSNSIIAHLSKSYLADSGIVENPVTFLPSDTEKWNEWSERKLAVMLYPNITRSFSESWECFSYASDVESWSLLERYMVRVLGPVAMFFKNGTIKKKYGIVNERDELHALLLDWTGAVGEGKFLHGDAPSLPDVLVYGVLRSIEGTQTFTDITARNSTLAAWYERVKAVAPPTDRHHKP